MQTSPRGPRKFLSQRRSVCLLGLLTVLVLGVLGAMYLFSPLPKGAYPVLSTAQWAGQRRGGAYPLQWLPNGDLAYLAKDSNGIPQICYQKMNDRGPVGAVRHGPELPIGSWFDLFWISPDEQWIASMQRSGQKRFQTFLLSADGKTTRTGGQYFIGWLADSRSYITIVLGPSLTTKVCHLDSPQTETIPAAPPGNTPTPTTLLASRSTFLIGSNFYNPGPLKGNPQNYPSLTMRSFDVSHPDVVQETWQAIVPMNMTFVTASVSPDNHLLLWSAGKYRYFPWSDWLSRLNVKWHQDPTFERQYFLSDLHGANLHPVLTNRMGGTLTLTPTWTPDSKHLSFIYQNKLYLVPVE